MEKEIKPFGKKRFLKLFLIAASIFLAMYICAMLGYRFVRNEAPQEENLPNGAQNINEQTKKETSVPFHLPYHEEENAQNGMIEDEVASTSSVQQNVTAQDENDYLVIAENNAVNLYILTKEGEKIFSKTLSVEPDSLMPEDRKNLESGIILASNEELSALLEDYTS